MSSTDRFHRHPLTLFGVYFLASGLIAAMVAYPLWMLLPGFEFDKVLSRAAILAAAALLVPLLRHLALSREEMCLGRFNAKSFLAYWILGWALIMPPSVAFVLIDFRVFDVRVLDNLAEVFRVAALAVVSGVLVGLFEEVLFRGALLSLWERVAPGLAVIGSSAVYAAVHFVEAAEPVVEPGWLSGFSQLASAFSPLLRPLEYWDSFAGLFLLGVGLCWVRQRTGSLWPCIAMHGAFVMFLKVYKDLTIRDIDVPLAWVVGGYDNFVGELTSVWLLVVLAGWWLVARARR